MRNVMLPGNPHAVPVVNVDTDGPEDEPGEEMAREARVWKTYVRETDRWDKELIDGRNNSLDVMLIFAALFSAISTTFILESLGDLKPDPAESSAQTLLVMSQTLTAMANGQPVSLPAQNNSDTTAFSPSRSAVTVNVLWLLSLSLSVAVSLIAMLAKEWCYKFMSGRSGPIYGQARRRQEKWNGIERWKMQEILAWLPGAMHLALLLFATGLCVYLWDINIGVAVPVVVMTVSTTCVYTLVTILPWIDKFCPYSTPATVVKAPLLALLEHARSLAWRVLLRQGVQKHLSWLQPALKCAALWLEPRFTSRTSARSTTEGTKVPMDTVTTQMLAWLIENCEDQRSVDTALQAFSGAYDGLPVASLGRVPSDLAKFRLDTCVKPDPKSKSLSAEELSQLSVALRYSRAYITLWPRNPDAEVNFGNWREMVLVLRSAHIRLLNLAHRQRNDSGTLAIVATSVAMPVYLTDYDCLGSLVDTPNGISNMLGDMFVVLNEAIDSVISILAQHFRARSATLSASTIYRLAQSSAHYLVGHWSGVKPEGSHALLPILLARVVITYHDTAPDTACAAAVTLAAAAFACDTYPGGEEPTLDYRHRENYRHREKRAMSLLRHYQTHPPDRQDMMMLFLFGFFGVLPRCMVNGLDMQLAAIIPSLYHMLPSNTAHWRPWSTPQSFSLRTHIFTRLFECFSSGPHAINGELTRVLTDLCSFALKGGVIFDSYYYGPDLGSRAYANALIALCFAESESHQIFLMRVIDAQRIPDAPVEQPKSTDNNGILWHLCHALLNTRTTVFPVAALHFGLLVASTISSTKDSLYARRSALRPLLNFHDRFPDLMWPSPFVFEELVLHLEQCITEGSTFNSLARTMQFVVDFCDADKDPNVGSGTGLDGGTIEVDWRGKLQELKRRYRPNINEGPSIEEIGYPRPVEVPAEVTVVTPGTASGAVEIWPNHDYPDDTEWCC